MRSFAFFALIALAPFAAQATDCFDPDRVRSFEVVSDQEIVVDAGRYDYKLVLNQACPGIERADRVAFSSSPSSFVQSRLPHRVSYEAQSRGIAIVDPPHRVCGRGEWLVPSGIAFSGQTPSCRIADVVKLQRAD